MNAWAVLLMNRVVYTNVWAVLLMNRAVYMNVWPDGNVVHLTGAMIVPTSMFWLFNALFIVADSTGKPSFITRYRIQVDKNNPVRCHPNPRPTPFLRSADAHNHTCWLF